MDAFTKVDESVSKKVFGSDGTLSWQNWKTGTDAGQKQDARNADSKSLPRFPQMGKGRGKRMEEGWEDVRGEHERGGGYTNFRKRKAEAEEEEEDDGNNNSLHSDGKFFGSRVERMWRTNVNTLPEGKKAYLPSGRWAGKCPGYVFKMEDGKLGYFFDEGGWVDQGGGKLVAETVQTDRPPRDQSQQQQQQQQQPHTPSPQDASTTDPTPPKKKKKKEKKKAKSSSSSSSSSSKYRTKNSGVPPVPETELSPKGPPPVISQEIIHSISSVSAPQVEVQRAIQLAREKRMWTKAVDATSGREYFYNTETGETKWDMAENTMKASGELPPGWVVVMDQGTGREYYYNRITQETRWERPV